MNTMTDSLDLTRFTKETGFRFRVTNRQKAQIELTKLSEAERAQVAQAALDAVPALFGVQEQRKWMEIAQELAGSWSDDLALTREAAYEAFMAVSSDTGQTGLDKLRSRKPAIPDEIFLQEGLTLENFSERLEVLIGVKRRFRLSRPLAARVKAKEITREQAFAETVAAKRAAQAEENTPNE